MAGRSLAGRGRLGGGRGYHSVLAKNQSLVSNPYLNPYDAVAHGVTNIRISDGDKLLPMGKAQVRTIETDTFNETSKASKRQTSSKGTGGNLKEENRIAVDYAVAQIGGLLATMDASARFATLKKICGAFNYKPSGSEIDSGLTKSKTAKADKTDPKPKTTSKSKMPHNEVFTNSTCGKLLTLTSKAMKEQITQPNIVCTEECFQLHNYLLKLKAKFKDDYDADNKTQPPVFDLNGQTPEEACGQILATIKKATQAKGESASEVSSIVEGAWCLCCGTEDHQWATEGWAKTDRTAWDKVTKTLQRTDEETKIQASKIMDRKATKKEKKRAAKKIRNDGDTETAEGRVSKSPVPNGDPCNVEAAEADPKEGAKTNVEAMVLDPTAQRTKRPHDGESQGESPACKKTTTQDP